MMPPDVHENGSDLNADIVALVRGVATPLVEIRALSAPNSPRAQPVAFRLRFADGRLLKCRLFPHAEAAARVAHLLRVVAHPALPRVVARWQRALLLEWVEGRALSDIAPTPELLARCGRLQANLHGLVAPGVRCPTPREAIGDQCRRLDSRLGRLVDGGVLTASEARTAAAMAGARAPADCAVGLVHNDLCAENVVLGPAGNLSVIDNESLQVGSIEYALGRTWYRWPMGDQQHEAYFDGYGPDHGAAGFRACFPFWAIAVLVDAAVYRMGTPAEIAAVPVLRLRALLAARAMRA